MCTHRHELKSCTTCQKYRSCVLAHRSEQESQGTENLIKHYNLMREENIGFRTRKEIAKQNSSRFLSIILSSQTDSFNLPHFADWSPGTEPGNSNSNKGKIVGVSLFRVEECGFRDRCFHFIMTREYERNGIHIVEVIHRMLSRIKKEQGRLPEILFLEADNEIRRGKNVYVMAYLQSLVGVGVFREVQVSFLPEGHDLSNKNGEHSYPRSYLETRNAVVIEDVIGILSCVRTGMCLTEEITKVANFSGLCEASGCLLEPDVFNNRYFRFKRKNVESVPRESMEEAPFQTVSYVKPSLQSSWALVKCGGGGESGFVKFVPDFHKTPATFTIPPHDIEYINKQMFCCQRFINEEQTKSLRALIGKVYRQRIEAFHWDLEEAFELRGDYCI